MMMSERLYPGDPLPEPEMDDCCACGSGDQRQPLHDARGLFVSYVCDGCVEDVKSHYRPEIFTDSSYESFEPIDDDDGKW